MPDPFAPFWEAIRFQARLDPHSAAVVSGAGQVAYGTFWHHILLVTQRLQRVGLAPGTVVAVQVQQLYLRWVATVALARLGLVSASASDAPQELEQLAAQAVISDRPNPGGGRQVIEAGEHWLDGTADPGAPLPVPDPGAPCRLVLSSGTTGTPRKVLLTLADVSARTRANARSYGLHPGVRLATTMSPQAIGGFMLPLSCWVGGGAVIMASVPAASALPHLLQLQPQVLFASPMQLAELMATLPPDQAASGPLRIFVAGSPLPPALSHAVRLRLTHALFISYGSTEAGTVTIGHASGADRQPGFAGHAVPGAQVEIVDGRHRAVPAGQPGEVRIRAAGMAHRYEDGDEADGNFRGGWFYPGDAGILDDSGGLAIIGRTHEVMNFGGVKLGPERVEEALQGCPGVVEFAAFALAAAGGQVPWVAVVAGEDFRNETMAARFAASFPGLPALSIARVDRLPRNAAGKVLRGQLEAMVGAALAASPAAPSQAPPPACA